MNKLYIFSSRLLLLRVFLIPRFIGQVEKLTNNFRKLFTYNLMRRGIIYCQMGRCFLSQIRLWLRTTSSSLTALTVGIEILLSKFLNFVSMKYVWMKLIQDELDFSTKLLLFIKKLMIEKWWRWRWNKRQKIRIINERMWEQ